MMQAFSRPDIDALDVALATIYVRDDYLLAFSRRAVSARLSSPLRFKNTGLNKILLPCRF